MLRGQGPDHGAGVHRLTKRRQRSTDRDSRMKTGQQASDAPGPRGGDFDYRLVGFDRDQGLIGDHVVSFGDMPRHDFCFGQALAEVG